MKLPITIATVLLMLSGSLCAEPITDLVKAFANLERNVMFRTIETPRAKTRLRGVITKLRKALLKKPEFATPPPLIWSFPIVGGRVSTTVGGKGSGFRPQRPKPAYDFYHGNKHGGHPAHDLFIRDRDWDCRHDRTGKEVNVRAMTSGIVVSLNRRYEAGKPRGGIYAFIYNPHLNQFHYYAHFGKMSLSLGQLVKAGQIIGTVGKSGFSRPRPCHIHLMVLNFADAKMVAYNYLKHLK